MMGNTREWVSDQCDFTGTSCANPVSPLDPGNSDVGCWTIPTSNSVLLDTLAEFSPALGIPLNVAEDGSIDAAIFGNKYHGDNIFDNLGATSLNGLIIGGGMTLGRPLAFTLGSYNDFLCCRTFSTLLSSSTINNQFHVSF